MRMKNTKKSLLPQRGETTFPPQPAKAKEREVERKRQIAPEMLSASDPINSSLIRLEDKRSSQDCGQRGFCHRHLSHPGFFPSH